MPSAIIYNLSLDGDECYFANNIFNHNTGIYGPYKTMIVPKTKKAMAFGKTIGHGRDGTPHKEHVLKQIKGIQPMPFIAPTFHQHFIEVVIDAFNEAFKEVEIRV